MARNVEVRGDLQRNGGHIGTRIVDELVAEYEIYIGPTSDSIGF